MSYGSINHICLQGKCVSELHTRNFQSGIISVEFDCVVELYNQTHIYRVLFFGKKAAELKAKGLSINQTICFDGYLDSYFVGDQDTQKKQSNKIVGVRIISISENGIGFSNVIFVGVVGTDPVFREGKRANSAVTSFAILLTRPTAFKPFPDQPNNLIFNVTCADKLAHIAYKNLHKSRLIGVIGSLFTSTGASNVNGLYRVTINAHSVQFLSKKTESVRNA